MWHEQWSDLDARQIVISETGSLASGGFVLADPFDIQLHLLSESYLRLAWERVERILNRYQLHPSDLSWGWLHPGITWIAGIHPPTPSDYVGWTSEELARFWEDMRYAAIDQELQQQNANPPALRCAHGYPSLKWRIAPEEYPVALRMIEAMATEEATDWAPSWILRGYAAAFGEEGTADEPWLQIAQAVQAQDQAQLNEAVRAAKRAYSPKGYRLVVHGFGSFIAQPWADLHLQLPVLPES